MRGDVDFMEDLKDDVLSVTSGFDKEDRKFALDFLRKHVRVDDLHAEALEFFKKKTIVFGTGSFNPTIVVITKDAIPSPAKKMLESAFDKMGLNESQLYFATSNFVVTRRYIDRRVEFCARLLSTLKPKIILSFDGIDYEDDVNAEYFHINFSIADLLDKENKAVRTELNEHFKEVKSLLKDF